jgi:hypothetical protein
MILHALEPILVGFAIKSGEELFFGSGNYMPRGKFGADLP